MRIAREQFLTGHRRLPVCRRQHDAPMHRLDVPASCMNVTASQSSSSGWLGGEPCAPKSAAGFDETPAEMQLPQPVHEHPCRERMVLAEQPLGETSAVSRR